MDRNFNNDQNNFNNQLINNQDFNQEMGVNPQPVNQMNNGFQRQNVEQPAQPQPMPQQPTIQEPIQQPVNTVESNNDNNQSINNQNFNQDVGVNPQPVNQMNTQPMNNSFQQESVEQPVQPTPQPQPVPVDNSYTTNSSNQEPKKSKLGLIIVILLIIAAIVAACVFLLNTKKSDSSSSKINKNLKVDMDEYTLECDDQEICNKLTGNIKQIVTMKMNIIDKYYLYLILTYSGELYAYKTFSGNEIIKIDGSVDIKTIDYLSDNILCDSNVCYKIKDDYSNKTVSVNKVLNGLDTKRILSYKESEIFALDTNNKLSDYKSCKKYKDNVSEEYCKSDDEYIKLSPKEGTYLNDEIEIVNSRYILKNNKLYALSSYIDPFYLGNSTDWDNMVYYPSGREVTISGVKYSAASLLESDYVNHFDNVYNMWYWDKGIIDNFLIQTNDNTIYYGTGTFISSDIDDAYKESFNEKIENVYFNDVYSYSDYVLIVTKTSVYLMHLNIDKELTIKEISEYKKYVNNIRGLFIGSGNQYILLSNGKLYPIESNK